MSEATTEQRVVTETAAADYHVERIQTVTAAIIRWQRFMEMEVDARIDAEVAEAKALLASDAKNDATRKADATIKSETEQRKAGIAAARARGAAAMVDLLLGGRAPISRWP